MIFATTFPSSSTLTTLTNLPKCIRKKVKKKYGCVLAFINCIFTRYLCKHTKFMFAYFANGKLIFQT